MRLAVIRLVQNTHTNTTTTSGGILKNALNRISLSIMFHRTESIDDIGLSRILQTDKSNTISSLTKVICTIGVKSRTVEELSKLLEAGMSVARFDFSWGSHKYHTETLMNLRQAMKNTKILCATMLDTFGSEVAVRLAAEDVSSFDKDAPKTPLEMKKGNKVVLSVCNDREDQKKMVATSEFFPVVNCDSLCEIVAVGDSIFIGQYLFTGSETSSVYLTVESIDLENKEIVCTCNNDALMRGVLLTVQISNVGEKLPTISRHDENDIVNWGVKNNVDFISLSFTDSAEDVRKCRQILDEHKSFHTKICAKIERASALKNIDEIIQEADGVIISRGNLGTELPAEKVFILQKMILARCNYAGKHAIVARLVDTMAEAPRPTRAEATDVANAVLDGADALLLGAETLRGNFASETVAMVRKICREAERFYDHESFYNAQISQRKIEAGEVSQPEALASSAVRAGTKVGAKLIVVFTRTGETARMVSKYRAPMPVVSLVIPHLRQDSIRWVLEGESDARGALLARGIVPMLANPQNSEANSLLQMVFDFAKKKAGLVIGDRVVIIQKLSGTAIVKVQELT
ncbi:unnamed protein product [Bathycoccus prasinos]